MHKILLMLDERVLMVKGKQGRLRFFEIEPCEENRLRDYIERNHLLLQSFLLLLSQEITSELATFLESKGLLFMEAKYCEKLRRSQKTIPQPPINQDIQELEEIHEQKITSLVLNRIIRSGEEVSTEGNLIIYGRVNGGARIYAKGNVQIYGKIDGIVECEGEFIILTEIGNGSVLFAGEFLNPSLFDGNKKAIFRDGRTVEITTE